MNRPMRLSETQTVGSDRHPPSITISDRRLEQEMGRLGHPLACHGLSSRGRRHPEEPDEIRTPFERDAHRILHAKPFRRLRNKTQVFFSPENDHITTRLDHSLYVATISATICRALSLNDDLAFAIGLGHDLGHAPFGHSGELVLAGLLKAHRAEGSAQGEYTHEAQSLRVVDDLSQVSGRDFPGLNLSYEVRDGIRCHWGESREAGVSPRLPSDDRDPAGFVGRQTLPATIEGCVVRFADRVAWLARDYEDAQTALGEALPPFPEGVGHVLGPDNRTIINTLVQDLIVENQRDPGRIGFSRPVHDDVLELRDFDYRYIYQDERVERYRARADRLIERIFEELYDHLRRAPQERWTDWVTSAEFHLRALARFVSGVGYLPGTDPARVMVDFISLMTDGFAFRVFESIVLPAPLV